MEVIHKTWKKATYIKGMFKVSDNTNYYHPVDMPSVFTAYGAGIKSGNWRSGTGLNPPSYVIDNFFDTIGYNKHDTMYQMWAYCEELSNITWDEYNKNTEHVLELIELCNKELSKLATI